MCSINSRISTRTPTTHSHLPIANASPSQVHAESGQCNWEATPEHHDELKSRVSEPDVVNGLAKCSGRPIKCIIIDEVFSFAAHVTE